GAGAAVMTPRTTGAQPCGGPAAPAPWTIWTMPGRWGRPATNQQRRAFWTAGRSGRWHLLLEREREGSAMVVVVSTAVRRTRCGVKNVGAKAVQTVQPVKSVNSQHLPWTMTGRLDRP